MLTFIGMKFDIFHERIITNYIFDMFASNKISANDILVAVPGCYPRSIKKAKKSLLYWTTTHPSIYADISGYSINKGEMQSLKEGDCIIAISDYVKKTLIDGGISTKKITVVPMGVDTLKFKPGQKKDNIYRVIAVGNYSVYKGFGLLLKAWEELKLNNSELLIVGEPIGKMRSIAKEYSKRMKNIRLLSFTDPLPYYQQSSLLILPSITDAWGKVVTEAMACALPVIVSENTGAKQAVASRENGFIIPVNDVNAIKEKLLFFYNNPNEIKRMGKNALNTVQKEYTLEKFSENLYNALKEAIKK
jgi:glycosyltransferase involved in cell wall biosynthesis